MRRIYKSMIWVSVLALSAGAVSAQKAERKNVREGNKLYESEKYTESEIAYRKSLEVNPRSTEGTYNLGNSLYKQGKFPEAAEQYQLIAGQGEKMVATPEGKARLSEVYHNMGNIFMQNKDYGKAVEVYKQSLRLNPKDDETRYNLALAQKLLSDQQNQDQSQDQQNDDKQENKDQKDDQNDSGGNPHCHILKLVDIMSCGRCVVPDGHGGPHMSDGRHAGGQADADRGSQHHHIAGLAALFHFQDLEDILQKRHKRHKQHGRRDEQSHKGHRRKQETYEIPGTLPRDPVGDERYGTAPHKVRF